VLLCQSPGIGETIAAKVYNWNLPLSVEKRVVELHLGTRAYAVLSLLKRNAAANLVESNIVVRCSCAIVSCSLRISSSRACEHSVRTCVLEL